MYEIIEQHYIENFDKLVKRYANRAGSVWNAEDVVQDSFDRAMRYSDSFSPERQEFGAWFNMILNNALRDFKRDDRLLGMSVEYSEELDEVEPLLEWEGYLLESINDDINAKSVQVRQALYLYIFKQYKPREIEQVVDMSNAYIRTSVKEFKQEMRAKYGDVL